MKLKTWIHRPAGTNWKFKVKEWTCCGYIWQLLMSNRCRERYNWKPVCPKCKKQGD
jgi:hypothetical protein